MEDVGIGGKGVIGGDNILCWCGNRVTLIILLITYMPLKALISRTMAKERHRDDINHEEEDEDGAPSKRPRKSNSKSDPLDSIDEKGSNRKRSSKNSSRNRISDEESDSSSSEDSDSSSGSDSDSYSEYSSEEERRRRRRKRRKKREEKERERERSKRRRKDKDKKKRKSKRDEEKEDKVKKRKHNEKKKSKKKMNKDEKGKTGAVTNLWGKFGIIRETDMWNKRPEFTAWLSEVKKINLESLPNWEEKQMFKEFMEDHNTATFPSKKYYNLDTYYKHKMEKEMKKGLKKVSQTERTTFDDEEQRRLELLRERERQKDQEVEALKCSMQSGMAQAMKEQARLREEMAYLFKIGNSEAAAAIQRRLDPDLPM